MAWDMANVHNLLLRGLNAIYLQCENVKKADDIADFVLYIKAWGDAVHHHHHSEEVYMFPKYDQMAKDAGETGIAMSTNVDQHAAFESGFQKLRDYATDVQSGKEYDSKVVKAMIDDFAPVFTQHLHDEVDSLFLLERFDGKTVRKIFDDTVKESVGTIDPVSIAMAVRYEAQIHTKQNLALPVLFGCIDKTSKGNESFPTVPFFLPWLNAYWYAKKNKGCWRFNPCDVWGQPRPLEFVSPAAN